MTASGGRLGREAAGQHAEPALGEPLPRQGTTSSVVPTGPKAPTQLVGNVGLYYACYRLSLLGWNVMPTSRNARGIDILCYSQDGRRTVTVQVKALSKRNPVPLGLGLDNLVAQFMIVVRNANVVPPAHPESFVLTPAEVGELVHISKDGKGTHWLQPRQYEAEQFKEAWVRIGTGN